MAACGALTGLSYTASAQEIQRTGGGFAKSECFISAGSCGGIGPATCPGPDCNTSVSGNGTNFVGVTGEARISMSAANINVSGSASFTPPSYCTGGQSGDPIYNADGNQSIYANVPNGTPIRITIVASLSGAGGGWATWSDAKSGGGGTSGTTIFNAVAGPGKITVAGVDYYLIDSIRANGTAVSRRICSVNSQSFSASVSLQFEVLGKTLIKLPGGDGRGIVGERVDNLLYVRVFDTDAGVAVDGEPINFKPLSCPDGYDVNPRQTATINPFGIASALASIGPDPGMCTIEATCPGCVVNKVETFTIIGELPPDLNLNQSGNGDGSGGPSPSDGDRKGGGFLGIDYSLDGANIRAARPDHVFIGVLTGDNVTFRARPQSGQLQWFAPGGGSSGPEFSTTFTDEFNLSLPATIILSRGDGKSAAAKLLSVNLPPGPSDEVAKAAAFLSLCTSTTGAACIALGKSWLDAYAWASATFEPRGRKKFGCGNNCCDAGKHMYWHAYVTKNISQVLSEFLGLAHERDNSPHNEKVMDITNNHLAQQIGLSNPPNVGAAVLQSIKSGQALVLYDASNFQGLSPLELSTRCAGF